MPQFGPTADGYHMTNMLIGWSIMTAYVPQTQGSAFYSEAQVKGAPDWFEGSGTTSRRVSPTRIGRSGRNRSRRR